MQSTLDTTILKGKIVDKENPCLYKAVCKICKLVDNEDRPNMCIQIACGHYTPCPVCKQNKALLPDGMCVVCGRDRTRKAQIYGRDTLKEEVQVNIHSEEPQDTPTLKQHPLAIPGQPPSSFTEEEKKYYLYRWKDYEGYYRDPASYVICHNMIIEEMNLSWIQSDIFSRKGEALADLEKRKSVSIDNLNKLKNQLPEKESQELSDDEKSLGMIHELYLSENKLRSYGKYRRMLSPEAIALCPQLPFPIDPIKLLANLGYSIEEAETVAARFLDYKTKEQVDPQDILEFFGFKLKERYAIDGKYDAPVAYTNDEDISLYNEELEGNT